MSAGVRFCGSGCLVVRRMDAVVVSGAVVALEETVVVAGSVVVVAGSVVVVAGSVVVAAGSVVVAAGRVVDVAGSVVVTSAVVVLGKAVVTTAEVVVLAGSVVVGRREVPCGGVAAVVVVAGRSSLCGMPPFGSNELGPSVGSGVTPAESVTLAETPSKLRTSVTGTESTPAMSIAKPLESATWSAGLMAPYVRFMMSAVMRTKLVAAA